MGDLATVVMTNAHEPSQRLLTHMEWLIAALCVVVAIEVFTAAVLIGAKLRARKPASAEPAKTLEEVA